MNAILWILQILLAAIFAWHGWLLLSPPPELVEIMNKEFALWFRMFLGIAEVLAAVGILLPGILKIMPWMTLVTAVGMLIVTASATVHHSLRGETSSAVTTAVLFVVIAFVGYMRWRVKPFVARK